MSKTKTDQLYLTPSKINLSDEDLIARPHGFVDSQELLTKATNDLTKEFKAFRRKQPKEVKQITKDQKSIQELSSKKISKQDLKKELKRVKKDLKLGAKEGQFLDILSDFKQHKTSDLAKQVKTSAHRKMKQRLNKKLKGSDFSINGIYSDDMFKQSCYQLFYNVTDAKL